MSANSRRRKLNDLRRKAQDSADQPKTHCVLSLDTYMGDGEDSASYGVAGINDVFGPFTEAEAQAFVAERPEEMFTEYQVRSLSPS
jgi:hypothetical protein